MQLQQAQHDIMDRVTWKYISFLLFGVGILCAGSVLWMLFWLTTRIEQVERTKTYDLVNYRIDAIADILRAGTEDYAYWTLAYELVTQKDAAGVYDNLGSGATSTDLFDQLFILNPDGTLLYAYDGALGVQAEALYEPENFAPILTALSETGPAKYQSVTGLSDMVVGVSVVTAAWITPDDISERPPETYPVIVATKQIDEDNLGRFFEENRVQFVGLYPVGSRPDVSERQDSLELQTYSGDPLAVLVWDVQSSGLALREELLPSVLAICLFVAIICGYASFNFRAQQRRLDAATQVACTDQLTGLLNRAGLGERMRESAALQMLNKGHLGAIYIDLNKFKQLNDTYGHLAGDIALRSTAERLQRVVRKGDLVARLGGDEFLCVIFDADPEATMNRIAKRFIEATAVPIMIDGTAHHVSGSVGIAVATSGMQWETVVANSDAAMYWAKQENAAYPVIYCKSMYENRTEDRATRLSA